MSIREKGLFELMKVEGKTKTVNIIFRDRMFEAAGRINLEAIGPAKSRNRKCNGAPWGAGPLTTSFQSKV